MGLFGTIKSIFGGNRLNIERRFATLNQANSGTMSRVLKVQEHSSGKVFALKILDAAKTAEFEEKFQGLNKPSEGEISLAIKHPGVVETFEHGLTANEEPFLLMEYLDGAGLHTHIVPPEKQDGKRLIALIRSAAKGLAAVHAAGYVHRDVCPHNFVALKQENRAKLIDFGLAIPSAPAFQLPNNRSGKTDYMAPEIIRRQPTDHRVDIFAFGASVYQLCAGRLPWETTAKGSFTSAARDVTDIHKFRPKIDARVARAIERCLVLDPAGRFQSLDEFARDLGPVASIDA